MPAHHLNPTAVPTGTSAPGPSWLQHNVTFTDPSAADHVAIRHLGPALCTAEDAGLISDWWFIRKDPWRLRYRASAHAGNTVTDLLNHLLHDGHVRSWTPGIYEPETLAFGGGPAMEVAHTLFHHDSRHFLSYAARRPLPVGRREITIVLCSVLLRGAGLDWYEQGDAWSKVAVLRPGRITPTTAGHAAALTAAMRQLMTADTDALCDPARGGPLAGHADWITAFDRAGRALAELARQGRLQRGLREVLAHHVIFHANRVGLSTPEQVGLAALAVNTVFPPPEHTRH